MSTENCVVIIGGLAMPEVAYSAEIAELKKSGAKVLFFSPQGTLLEKTSSVLAKLSAERINEAVFVGYSLGTIVAALICQRKPSLVQQLVLVNPAGLTGKDSGVRIACRFSLQAVKEMAYVLKCALHFDLVLLKISIRVGMKFFGGCFANFRLWQDLSEMARVDMVSLLRDIEGKGIKVTIVSAHSDCVFSEDRIAQTIETSRLGGVSWVVYVWAEATHNMSFLCPPFGTLKQVLGW